MLRRFISVSTDKSSIVAVIVTFFAVHFDTDTNDRVWDRLAHKLIFCDDAAERMPFINRATFGKVITAVVVTATDATQLTRFIPPSLVAARLQLQHILCTRLLFASAMTTQFRADDRVALKVLTLLAAAPCTWPLHRLCLLQAANAWSNESALRMNIDAHARLCEVLLCALETNDKAGEWDDDLDHHLHTAMLNGMRMHLDVVEQDRRVLGEKRTIVLTLCRHVRWRAAECRAATSSIVASRMLQLKPPKQRRQAAAI